ncbi:SMP-30/gluconolactonase/LRE family protein [Actibacterium mucosum]|nr:SMP-30/gluconolactonase/LRE family protein [Actibacterium mucosum]
MHKQALVQLVGERYVLGTGSDNDRFLKDWSGDLTSSPLCIVQPGNVNEVSSVARYCHEHGLSMIPQGGNTGLVGGTYTQDENKAVVLNLSRLNNIREVDADNYTMQVESGCIVQTIQDEAAKNGRLFPLSFGAIGSAQIGGALATNAGGLNVLRYGMTRNMVLGIEVVLPDGRILDLMSELRKDNSGPDLKHLFIGTEGTFGIVTAVSLQLYPAIQNSETAMLALTSLDAITKFYSLARSHCADLMSAFELLPQSCVDLAVEHQSTLRSPMQEEFEYYALIRLAASGPIDLRGLLESLVERAFEEDLVADGIVAESLSQAEMLWAIREAMVEAQAARGRHIRTDISVRVSQIPEFIRRAEGAVTEAAPDWLSIAYGHVGDGNVHFNILPPQDMADDRIAEVGAQLLDIVYGVLGQMGGSVSAEHGIGRVRRKAMQRQSSAVRMDVSQSLKETLDPLGILNPGCIFPAKTIDSETARVPSKQGKSEMAELSASLILDCRNNLGEGIQWNVRTQRVYWTDIFGDALWSCAEDGSAMSRVPLDKGLCAMAFTDNDRALAAFTDGLCWLDVETGARELIKEYQPEEGARTRMNDGGLDRQGRFVVGGIDEEGMHPITPVWSVDKGDVRTVIEGIGCANSTCFSPDGTRMYFADTRGKDVVAYDYDTATGTPSNPRVFATLGDGEGGPDGSTVDAEGGLWNTQFGGGAVQRFLPDGSRDMRVTLPVPNITCCAIGGAKMNRLFITTARLGMEPDALQKSPLAGGLFAVDLPVTGIDAGTYKL